MPLTLVREYAPHLIDARSSALLSDCLSHVARELGFDHFALTYEPRIRFEQRQSILMHNYPAEWAEVYVSFGLAGQDPVRRACDRTVMGFEWRNLENLIPMTVGDRRMLSVGRQVGVADGYTVPRHLAGEGSGSCSFVVGPQSDLPRERLEAAELLGAFAIEAARGLAGLGTYDCRPVLSDRQRECVLWSARGKTAAEAAIIMGVTESTVRKHLRDARERYNVHCGHTLILCALYDGLISFPDLLRWWNNLLP
ncbi:LuxR family transcriptional regulator [Novosphingobium sp. SL115]|uniref:helix-turn-helix transcriptional regulator n=1 Tax=Novosphingobium sp. SL115 TaxID=2995150 RepID=UPI0022728883|nr:LuxR family transcriptional regulator [Novosphingobium sp. SL115]MCY1669441.1 LuxR family transcriptional regulator [Novosphingobium sp. SL115]